MAHLMMMHQPMQMHTGFQQQPNNQFMNYHPSYNPLMMSPLQQPMQQPIQHQLYPINQMMMLNPHLNPYSQQPLNQVVNPEAAVQPLSHSTQSINQPISRPISSAVQPLSQSNNQTNNQTTSAPAPSVSQIVSPSMNPMTPPTSSEVRVSFSSMLTHPQHPTIVYFQLRADGHNQDLIIEHPTGWSIVRPEAHFVEHLVNQLTNARIAREKWPMPSPMQLLFKSCDTSRLLPDRTVTRFTVARSSQMEWKEAMKAVKSLKDEEVIRAKMRISFGLLRPGETLQAPVVAYESVILLGWRTTRSSAKRRQHKMEQEALAAAKQLSNQSSNSSSHQTSNSSSAQSSSQLFGQSDSLYGPVPDLILEPADSAVSTPSSSGSAMMNNSLGHISMSSLNNRTINQSINQSMNKRAREVSQQINHAAENIDDLIRSDSCDEQNNKRAKLFSDGLVKRPSPIRRASNQSIKPSINQ